MPSVCAMASKNAEMDSATAPIGLGEQGVCMHALSGGIQPSQRRRPEARIPVLGSGRAARHRPPTRRKAASPPSPSPSPHPLQRPGHARQAVNLG